MVRLPKRVLKRWREIFDDPDRGDDTIIEVLLSSRLGPVQATNVLSQSLARATASFEATHTKPLPDTGGALPFAGEWTVTPVPDGALLIGGRKSDDAGPELLQAIVEDLGGQGISGKLDLYTLPEAPTALVSVDVIEATVRVAGGRKVERTPASWIVDPQAIERVMRAGVEWCLEARPDRGITVQSGANPAMLLRRCDSPFQRALDVLYRDYWTTVQSIGEDRYRSVTAQPNEGRVTVFEAGPRVHHQGWGPSVEALTSFLSITYADAVYGRVRRANDAHDAQHPYSAMAETDRLAHTGMNPFAYEDHLARDAYAIQLLGPGYGQPLPTGDQWLTTQLDDQHALLEHHDPAAWFDEITLADAIHGRPLPPAELVQRARSSLASILFPRFNWRELKRAPGEVQAQPPVVLPQNIVTRVQMLSHTTEGEARRVALVTREGRVVENVKLSPSGAVVTEIAGNTHITLDPRQVIDVLDHSA